MAKTAKEKTITPAMQATLDARQKHELAKKAADAKPDDKKLAEAAANAKAAVATAQNAENRERFVRVGGGRVKKARIALRNLSGVAAPRSYTYTSADVDKLETVLSAELATTVKKMRAALDKGASAPKAEDDFTF